MRCFLAIMMITRQCEVSGGRSEGCRAGHAIRTEKLNEQLCRAGTGAIFIGKKWSKENIHFPSSR